MAFGILDPSKERTDANDPYLMKIALPKGLSFLANHDFNSFVPGINDLIDGVTITETGDTVRTVTYAERIAMGKKAHEALRAFDKALAAGDNAAMDSAKAALKENYQYFGYGYLDSADEAVPPVGMTFYSFHIMVLAGGYLTLFLIIVLVSVYRYPTLWNRRWWQWISILSIAVVWICSEAGWVTAEVGRQPWIIEGLMPTRAAISAISSASVQLTFWMFAAVFTALLIAEITIMLKQIKSGKDEDKY